MSRAKQEATEGIVTQPVNDDAAIASERTPKRSAVARRIEPALPHLVAVRIAAFDEATGRASLHVGSNVVEATLDPSLSVVVVQTAVVRGERVIAQQEREGWIVLGALRTSPTPGVDEGDEFLIKARRITFVAAHELSIVSGAASLVLRAYGHIETLGHDITSRASSAHKIIGRMIRLN